MASDKKQAVTSYDELFPGRFLKAGLLKGKHVTVTIAGVYREPMEQEDGTEELQGIVGFKESPLELALNRTNGECLKAMFGPKPGEWIGKRGTIKPDRCRAFGEEVDCIRIEGSPNLAKDVTFDLKLPRKKAKRSTMKKTGNG